VIRDTFQTFVYSLVRTESFPPEAPPDLSPKVLETYRTVRLYTMGSVERISALVEAVHYMASAEAEGSIVECGKEHH